MSIVTMFDFLPNATPDYITTTLTVDPEEVMVVSGEKDVEIHQGRGGSSDERVILSEQSKFWVKLQWRNLSEDDHSTLFDFYHSASKGCGTARTFYWQPPEQYDSHIYVVRFDSKWESFLQNYKNYGVATLILYVPGRKEET